jgi:hypothetical protein
MINNKDTSIEVITYQALLSSIEENHPNAFNSVDALVIGLNMIYNKKVEHNLTNELFGECVEALLIAYYNKSNAGGNNSAT